MKLKDIIEIHNNLNVNIGSLETRFVLKYNISILEPVFNAFSVVYNENQSSINNKELEKLLNKEIDVSLIYLSIEDIPEDIGTLNKEEIEVIFKLVK